MKFKVDRNEFLKNLEIVSSIVPVKPVLTIISNIMIDVKKDKLMLFSTDFEISLFSEVECSSSGDGIFVLNAKTLVDLIRRLPDGEINFNYQNDNVTIKTKTGEYRIPTLKKEEYVEIIRIEKERLFPVDSLPLKSAIDNTIFATSKDTVKVAITGVLFEMSKKSLTMVATDSHRLALNTIGEFFEDNVSGNIIVPPKVLQIIRDLLDEKEQLYMGFDDKKIMFKVGKIEMWAKLIDGTYPDYKRVIPYDNNKIMIVNKNELLTALNAVNVFVNVNTKLVKFEISKNRLVILAYQNQQGEGKEELEVKYNDEEPINIGFNINYLMEILKRVESENVKFKMKGEMFAVLIENEESKIGEESFYIIMPLRLK